MRQSTGKPHCSRVSHVVKFWTINVPATSALIGPSAAEGCDLNPARWHEIEKKTISKSGIIRDSRIAGKICCGARKGQRATAGIMRLMVAISISRLCAGLFLRTRMARPTRIPNRRKPRTLFTREKFLVKTGGTPPLRTQADTTAMPLIAMKAARTAPATPSFRCRPTRPVAIRAAWAMNSKIQQDMAAAWRWTSRLGNGAKKMPATK